MHRLHRNAPPVGLRRYRHDRHAWGGDPIVPSPGDRADIWTQLNAMQGARCAYCETPLSPDNRHIEHFRQRSRYPQGTFDWDNLFGSCNRSGTCGDHKDKCGFYEPSDLLKPDVDEPDDYLVFVVDGTVQPKAGLSPEAHHRAAETIRILNLNAPALRQARGSMACGYQQTAEDFAEMATLFDESEWLPSLTQEVQATAHLPFATAIRHVLNPPKPAPMPRQPSV